MVTVSERVCLCVCGRDVCEHMCMCARVCLSVDMVAVSVCACVCVREREVCEHVCMCVCV